MKRNEIGARKRLFKNGKLFLPAQDDGSDFKELFKRIAAAGAGRPLGKDGFPAGPWTPEQLTEAISQIGANRIGVDLRTVQLWFQDNDKGVSPSNIRWLARVVGCDDPVATGEWQALLSASQSRMVSRRQKPKKETGYEVASELPETNLPSQSHAPDKDYESGLSRNRRFNLGRASAAIFTQSSPLNVPATVFAGMSALGFFSYIIGIHNITYIQANGSSKQVGFLWTANWTLAFMVFFPLFFAILIDVLAFWKREGRSALIARGGSTESHGSWADVIDASSYTFWSVFVICLLFAGVFQWIAVGLIPLLDGHTTDVTDWTNIAIARPEKVSAQQEIAFTALAYLYMSTVFYLFFAGLILLFSVVDDYKALNRRPGNPQNPSGDDISSTVLKGIFRCVVLGILVGLVMKLQSAYLASTGVNIISWLATDMASVFQRNSGVAEAGNYRMMTNFSSLLVVISAAVVFLYASIRLPSNRRRGLPLPKMWAVIVLLVTSYWLVNVFAGFSILLIVGLVVAIYSLFKPVFSSSGEKVVEGDQHAS